MQSGISASAELLDAFNGLVSDPQQRGLMVTIRDESLVPGERLPSSSSTSSFFDDLPHVAAKLRNNEAAYIILRRHSDFPSSSSATTTSHAPTDSSTTTKPTTGPFVAVTYVPDTAPVRQKMLFASTRLTLVRALGPGRVADALFATTPADLSADGWRAHDRHAANPAPLSAAEHGLRDLQIAEAETSRGTTARAAHVSSGLSMPMTDEARDALRTLVEGAGPSLVQLHIDVPAERIELAGTATVEVATLGSAIAATEPRYSFFRYAHAVAGEARAPLVFVYTCPTAAPVKARMLYASSKAGVLAAAEKEAGVVVAKKLEATSPTDIDAAAIHEELYPKQEQKTAFARPKRPGKR